MYTGTRCPRSKNSRFQLILIHKPNNTDTMQHLFATKETKLVPEPATLLLLGLGAAMLSACADRSGLRRKR